MRRREVGSRGEGGKQSAWGTTRHWEQRDGRAESSGGGRARATARGWSRQSQVLHPYICVLLVQLVGVESIPEHIRVRRDLGEQSMAKQMSVSPHPLSVPSAGIRLGIRANSLELAMVLAQTPPQQCQAGFGSGSAPAHALCCLLLCVPGAEGRRGQCC